MQTADRISEALLMRMLRGYQLSQAISVMAELRIADVLDDGPRSSHELAQETATHEPSLYRLLRALVAAGLLTESQETHFALTTLGALLRSGAAASLRATASYLGKEGPWRRWGRLQHKVQTGESPSRKVFVERWEENAEEAALFDEYMTEMATRRGAAVLAGYDFTGITRLVDVGGGHGRLLASILQAYPAMRGILFDLPHVIGGVGSLLDSAGVADRCERIEGDFFEAAPEGGDAYLLSVVIHDWDDERASSILKNCRRVMGPSGKLLLVERVVSTDSEQSLNVLLSDLQMLVGPGGRERTAEEFGKLLSSAGFRLARVVPLDWEYNVIEGVPS